MTAQIDAEALALRFTVRAILAVLHTSEATKHMPDEAKRLVLRTVAKSENSIAQTTGDSDFVSLLYTEVEALFGQKPSLQSGEPN